MREVGEEGWWDGATRVMKWLINRKRIGNGREAEERASVDGAKVIDYLVLSCHQAIFVGQVNCCIFFFFWFYLWFSLLFQNNTPKSNQSTGCRTYLISLS